MLIGEGLKARYAVPWEQLVQLPTGPRRGMEPARRGDAGFLEVAAFQLHTGTDRTAAAILWSMLMTGTADDGLNVTGWQVIAGMTGSSQDAAYLQRLLGCRIRTGMLRTTVGGGRVMVRGETDKKAIHVDAIAGQHGLPAGSSFPCLLSRMETLDLPCRMRPSPNSKRVDHFHLAGRAVQALWPLALPAANWGFTDWPHLKLGKPEECVRLGPGPVTVRVVGSHTPLASTPAATLPRRNQKAQPPIRPQRLLAPVACASSHAMTIASASAAAG